MQDNKLLSILPQAGLLMEEPHVPVLKSYKQAGFFVCITEIQKQVRCITSNHLGTSKYASHARKVDEEEQKNICLQTGSRGALKHLFI